MKSKIDYLVEKAQELKMNGALQNSNLTTPLYIRPKVMEKIKQMLKDDLMETCEDRENGLFQQYAITGKWEDE